MLPLQNLPRIVGRQNNRNNVPARKPEEILQQGWLFAMAKSIFAGTVEKTGKNRFAKTGKNWQKLENAVYVTGIRSSTLPGSSKRLNLLNLNL
jgi:hypothetical protein